MFGRRVFGGSADTFRLTLELGERAGLAITKSAPVDFEWTNDESDSAVLERFTQRKSELLFGRLEERVVASVLVSDFPPNSVRLLLSLEKCMPTLRCLQVSRVSSSGTVSESLLTAMLKHCDTHGVWKVKSSDGCGAFLFTCSEVGNWPALTHLNLSHCNIAALPPSVGDLAALTILRLSYNKLPALPAEVGKLTALQVRRQAGDCDRSWSAGASRTCAHRRCLG